jgi:hypothetical protein
MAERSSSSRSSSSTRTSSTPGTASSAWRTAARGGHLASRAGGGRRPPRPADGGSRAGGRDRAPRCCGAAAGRRRPQGLRGPGSRRRTSWCGSSVLGFVVLGGASAVGDGARPAPRPRRLGGPRYTTDVAGDHLSDHLTRGAAPAGPTAATTARAVVAAGRGVLLRRQRGHVRLRRPDPAPHLPGGPRAPGGRHGVGGGGALRAPRQRGPPPPRQAGRRRLPRGPTGRPPPARGAGAPPSATWRRHGRSSSSSPSPRRPRHDAPRPGPRAAPRAGGRGHGRGGRREYGRAMAASLGPAAEGQRSFRSGLARVADALTAHGFAATPRAGATPSPSCPTTARSAGRRCVTRHLRGRPRHGEGDARRPLRRHRPGHRQLAAPR